MFGLRRKYVIVPLLLGILLTPAGQNWNVGVHFYVYRILVLVGWARLGMSKPESGKRIAGGFITLDRVFLSVGSLPVVGGGSSVLAGRRRHISSFPISGFRRWIFSVPVAHERRMRVQRVVTAFAVVAVVSSVVMVRELTTGQNMMGLLGGIRPISDVRNGRIRAEGVFQHPIFAGSFGATVIPLFLWLWKRGTGKLVAMVGALSSTVMVFASASSTSTVPGWEYLWQFACGPCERKCESSDGGLWLPFWGWRW